MSANLDLVRSIYADWERGDYRRVDWAHAEIEFVMADVPDLGASRGVAGIREDWRDFLGAWEGIASRLRSTASSTLGGFSFLAAS